jgi:flagellar FliL protein
LAASDADARIRPAKSRPFFLSEHISLQCIRLMELRLEMATTHPMDTDEADTNPADEVPASPPRVWRKKLFIFGSLGLLVLVGIGAAYATGLAGRFAGGTDAHAMMAGSVELPEIVANLNAGARRTAFVRLKARLELANKADEPAVLAAEPRMRDLFQTYLRDMRPEELRGSTGTYRLREELIARANIAVAPAKVTEILFVELLVQ